jgi:hypothetical protein
MIKANAKDGGNRPVFTVKDYKQNRKAHRVLIDGPSALVYTPEKPLSCGARAYIITDASVITDEGAYGL